MKRHTVEQQTVVITPAVTGGLKIDHDVPMPTTRRPRGSLKAVARRMAIGDSVAVETRSEAVGLQKALYNLNAKASFRSVPTGGYRVWRVA